MKLKAMEAVLRGPGSAAGAKGPLLLFKTAEATVLAHDAYWDGRNWERAGRNTWLLVTPGGHYFLQQQSGRRGEVDEIKPLDVEAALVAYQQLREKVQPFVVAFPHLRVVSA